MANFNLNDYETVEQRHARAISAYPDLRCVIVNHTSAQDRLNNTWVVEARVYLNAGDQALDLPKAVDYAFEVDGQNGVANRTSALENASTSALGRALRWALAGSKGASREEMEKVAGTATPKVEVKVPKGFKERIAEADMDGLRLLWAEAVAGGFQSLVTDVVTSRKGELS